ncbi:MAG: hypothetical protein WCK98_06045 [bacterium]
MEENISEREQTEKGSDLIGSTVPALASQETLWSGERAEESLYKVTDLEDFYPQTKGSFRSPEEQDEYIYDLKIMPTQQSMGFSDVTYELPGRTGASINTGVEVGFFGSGIFWEAIEYLEMCTPENIYQDFGFLKNQTVVEIGPGSKVGFMPMLASLAGAKNYIAVEPYFSSDYLEALKNKNLCGNLNLESQDKLMQLSKKHSISDTMPISVVATDIFNFLNVMPSDFKCSFYCCGIDSCIIYDRSNRIEINNLISTKLHPQGGLINHDSVIQPNNVRPYDFSFQQRKDSQFISIYRKT